MDFPVMGVCESAAASDGVRCKSTGWPRGVTPRTAS
jgi:hypothetical protein